MPLVDGMNALDEALEAPEWSSLEAVREAIRKQLTQQGPEAANPSEGVINHWSGEMMGVLDDMSSARADAMRNVKPGDRRAWKVCEEGPDHRAMVRKGPEGTEVHTLLMEGVINGSVEAAVAMTRDVTFFKEWWPQQNMPVYKVIENRYLKRIGDGFDLTYMRFRTPWPFPGKEFAFMLLSVYDANTGLVTTVLQTPPEDNNLIDPCKHGFPREAVPPVPSGVARMAINGGFTVKDLGENRCHYRGIFTVDLKMPPALVNFVTKGFGGMLFTVFSKEVEVDLADTKGPKGPAFRKVLEEEQLYVRIREAMSEHRALEERKQQWRLGGGKGGAAAAAAGEERARVDEGWEGDETDGGESEAFFSPASSFSSGLPVNSLPPLSLDHTFADDEANSNISPATAKLHDATLGMHHRTSAATHCRSAAARRVVAPAAEAGAAGWVGRGRFGFRSSRRNAQEKASRLSAAAPSSSSLPTCSSSHPTPPSPTSSLASSLSQARLEGLGLVSVESSAHAPAAYQAPHSDLYQQMRPGEFDRIMAGGASEGRQRFGRSGRSNGESGSGGGGGRLFGSSWRFGSSSGGSRRDSDGCGARRKIPGSPGLGLWWKGRSARIADEPLDAVCMANDHGDVTAPLAGSGYQPHRRFSRTSSSVGLSQEDHATQASALAAAPPPPHLWLESPTQDSSNRRGSIGSCSSASSSPVAWEKRKSFTSGKERCSGHAGGLASGVLSPGWESGSTKSTSSCSSSSRSGTGRSNSQASSPIHGRLKAAVGGSSDDGGAAARAGTSQGYSEDWMAQPKQQLEMKRRQAKERRFLNFLKGGRQMDIGAR
ncbi:hypothetical protein CLOM_g20307 [Closterium sp. NIES-68]|nr:hypothetical protein CLOM_g20307 [Closterium sp. NIES-68]GJP61746.1 hypothetical protein CLOP_g18883 [Closterium sp. NIES-67]